MYVLIFSAIAFLVLLISCFNYINLVTANFTTRAMEIGMRKVCGASRNQLAMQYTFESLVVVVISFILSLLVAGLSLPLFNELSGKELSIQALNNRDFSGPSWNSALLWDSGWMLTLLLSFHLIILPKCLNHLKVVEHQNYNSKKSL